MLLRSDFDADIFHAHTIPAFRAAVGANRHHDPVSELFGDRDAGSPLMLPGARSERREGLRDALEHGAN